MDFLAVGFWDEPASERLTRLLQSEQRDDR